MHGQGFIIDHRSFYIERLETKQPPGVKENDR
jgi:hypothetical protein